MCSTAAAVNRQPPNARRQYAHRFLQYAHNAAHCSIGGAKHTVLFDTGPDAATFLRNSNILGVDFSEVDAVVLSLRPLGSRRRSHCGNRDDFPWGSPSRRSPTTRSAASGSPWRSSPKLAALFAVPTDVLLCVTDARPSARAGKRGPTPKPQRQLERLSRLPKAQQQVVLAMLDGVLLHHG